MKQIVISTFLFLAAYATNYIANRFSHLFDNISSAYGAFTALCILFALLGLSTAVITSTDNDGVLRLPNTLAALVCWMLTIPQTGLAIGLVVNYNSYVDIMLAARSASGEKVQSLGGGIAALDGDIGYGSYYSMVDAHQEEKITVLKLRSHGGVIDSATRIGEFLERYRINTYVDSYCESACVIVALYGSVLYVTPESRFGFHRASSVASNDSELGQYIANLGTGDLLSKLKELGIPDYILDKAETTPPQEMYYVSGSEFHKAGMAQLVENQ